MRKSKGRKVGKKSKVSPSGRAAPSAVLSRPAFHNQLCIKAPFLSDGCSEGDVLS